MANGYGKLNLKSRACKPRIVPMVRDKMFRFLWKKKKDKIKRTSMFQDLSTGGLWMVDMELTIAQTCMDQKTSL